MDWQEFYMLNEHEVLEQLEEQVEFAELLETGSKTLIIRGQEWIVSLTVVKA